LADQSKSWTDAQRERIEAGRTMPYLLGVVDGTEEPDADRIRVALALLAKRLPDLKAVEHTGQVDSTLTITWKS